MHKGEDGKLQPDYNQEEISKIASYFTPCSGRSRPGQRRHALKNLVKAAI